MLAGYQVTMYIWVMEGYGQPEENQYSGMTTDLQLLELVCYF